VGKSRGRWNGAVWRVEVNLLQILKWKAAASRRAGWRKEIGKSTARKAVEE
jgi:hypothetical protein